MIYLSGYLETWVVNKWARELERREEQLGEEMSEAADNDSEDCAEVWTQ